MEKLYEEEIEWIQNNSRISIKELNEREKEFQEKTDIYTVKEDNNVKEEEVKVEEVD